MSGIRSLVRRVSSSASVPNAIHGQEEAKWQVEREELLVSRLVPMADAPRMNASHIPPPKSALLLGPAVELPVHCAFRFTSRERQYRHGGLKAATPKLFGVPFAGGKVQPFIWESNPSAFQEVIMLGSHSDHNLLTQMMLVDWDFIPPEVDCLVMGLLLPCNYYAHYGQFSATGLLELLPADAVDENEWTRKYDNWPHWESFGDSGECAEVDLFRPVPELFDLSALYSTYVCASEVGFVNSYIWGK